MFFSLQPTALYLTYNVWVFSLKFIPAHFALFAWSIEVLKFASLFWWRQLQRPVEGLKIHFFFIMFYRFCAAFTWHLCLWKSHKQLWTLSHQFQWNGPGALPYNAVSLFLNPESLPLLPCISASSSPDVTQLLTQCSIRSPSQSVSSLSTFSDVSLDTPTILRLLLLGWTPTPTPHRPRTGSSWGPCSDSSGICITLSGCEFFFPHGLISFPPQLREEVRVSERINSSPKDLRTDFLFSVPLIW